MELNGFKSDSSEDYNSNSWSVNIDVPIVYGLFYRTDGVLE